MDLSNFGWILSILFGGTSIWGLIQHFLDRKKRKVDNQLDHAAKQHDLDDKEFELLKKQLDFQDGRLMSYEQKLKIQEELFDELRTDYITIKKEKFELYNKFFELQNRYNNLKQKECLVEDCPHRKKSEHA